MFPYADEKVNGGLKPMLRAIGSRFPDSKEKMVAILEQFDRDHPNEKPAHMRPEPPIKERKKKGSNTPAPAPAPTAPAQQATNTSQSLRKRKESPAVQPEPQTKRTRTGGKGVPQKSDVEDGQDEDAPMLDVDDDAAPQLDAAGPSRNTRLSSIDEEDGEQDVAQRAAIGDAQTTSGNTKDLQMDAGNSKVNQATAGGTSKTSRAQSKLISSWNEVDKRFAALRARAETEVRQQQATAQSNSSNSVPLKNGTQSNAAPKKGRKGKTPAMSDQGQGSTVQKQLDAVPGHMDPKLEGNSARTQKGRGKGKGKAVPSRPTDADEPAQNTLTEDNDGTILNTIEVDNDTQVVDQEPRKLTQEEKNQIARADRIKKGLRPGGYANPVVADYWPVREQTIVLSLDTYFPPGHKQYLELDQLHGDQWEDRYIAEEKAKGRVFEKMKLETPEPPGEEDMVDYYEVYDAKLWSTGVPSKDDSERLGK